MDSPQKALKFVHGYEKKNSTQQSKPKQYICMYVHYYVKMKGFILDCRITIVLKVFGLP